MRSGSATRGRRTVDVATGIRVSFEQWGPLGASEVVLLHPWLESSDSFSLMRPHLETELRFTAPDQRGHGASSKPPDGYDLPKLAADAEALLDALEIEAALVVGASSGGYVAQELAARYPGRVAGLVLAGSPRSLHGRTPRFAAELAGLRDPIDTSWATSFVAGFTVPGRVGEDFIAARVRDALAVPAEIWRESLAALTRSEPPASHLISAPTLVVSGAHDSLLGGEDAAELARTIPRAHTVEYADAGHIIHWEAPERLAGDVVVFADRVFHPH